MRRLTVIFFCGLLAASAWAYAPERKSLPRIDAENRLTTNWVAGAWKQEFVYDAFGRKRIERTYGWSGGWTKTNETRYVYDGRLPIQERDANNQVRVTYTRGLDLSGSLQGAGGIGGLLARTDHALLASNSYIQATAYYHADGAGNVTALLDARNNIAARYEFDAFGRQLAQWGPMAEVNRYRFSSKEVQPLSSLVYFLGRFYDPTIQRWITLDPLGEAGGVNLYQFVYNDPLDWVDADGWQGTPVVRTGPRQMEFEFEPKEPAPRRWGPGQMPEEEIIRARERLLRRGSPGDTALSAPRPQSGRQMTQQEWKDFLEKNPLKYEPLRPMAQRCDPNAAERTPVFWSGGRAAEDAARTFANANNGIVIGDTAAGRALAQSTAGVPWSQARPQWLNLSENFARSASGEVNVFQNARGVAVDSI